MISTYTREIDLNTMSIIGTGIDRFVMRCRARHNTISIGTEAAVWVTTIAVGSGRADPLDCQLGPTLHDGTKLQGPPIWETVLRMHQNFDEKSGKYTKIHNYCVPIESSKVPHTCGL